MEVLTNITHTHTPLATPLRFHLSSQGANIFVGGMVAMVGDLSWRGGAHPAHRSACHEVSI